MENQDRPEAEDLSAEIIERYLSREVFRKLGSELIPQKKYHFTALPAAAQAFVLAGLTRQLSGFKLILAKNVRSQEELANDLEAWGGEFDFFPQLDLPVAEAIPDPELIAERLAILMRIKERSQETILTTTTGAENRLPSPKELPAERLHLEKNREYDRDEFIQKFIAIGYQREAEVQERGTLSVRGAIVDIFPWEATRPIRLEWDDNKIISLREFDAMEQKSVRELKEVSIVVASSTLAGQLEQGWKSTLQDYLPASTIIFNLDETKLDEQALEQEELHELEFYAHDFLHAPRGDFILQEKRRELFLEHLIEWLEAKWNVLIFCNNSGEQKRLVEIIREAGIDPAPIQFILRPLLRGFAWPSEQLVVLSDSEIFGRYQTLRALKKQERLTALRSQQAAIDFSEIIEGDFVVHLHHGIALYRGLQKFPDESGREIEVLALEFAEGGKLYVPLEQAFLVSKYVGVGRKTPTLDHLGGTRWEKAKVSARKAAMDYAAELLKVQAERSAVPGHRFGPDTPWQKEFEEAFIYRETEDQLHAIEDAKRDMESSRPMDRLICGDVGFGKTEVAIRAIFKAVMEGKQAAFLVPTTVLAQQHYKTLSERFADFPIQVEVLSRFRTPKEQKKVVASLREGEVDVIVGTHRLISKDIVFKDLGLVVVDEEQRFGVVQKEKFKQRFRLVDVLTLSATPIPRTLYLALTGARDLSTIDTAPPNRYPVETVVSPYDERVIREAIRRELARNGQVYFLHNRIGSIEDVAARLKTLVPEAKIDIGHGRMEEGELEETMRRFVAGETDVLLSTTIIESGLDIPNANTILIDRADRFGLADLYQLRGRVGRAQHKAYAYLFLPRHLMSVADARKRVNAIRQYSQLGAGFKIAMRDLEIRGAGNLLGTAQSGHITAVGFDLYCQLLKISVNQIKGESSGSWIDCKLDFDFLAFREEASRADLEAAYLPQNYISESKWRIEAYRRLAELQSVKNLEKLNLEWRDRYGPFPLSVKLLLMATEIRILAAMSGIVSVETKEEKLILKKRNQDFIMIEKKFPRLTAREATSKLQEIKQWIISLGRAESKAVLAQNSAK